MKKSPGERIINALLSGWTFGPVKRAGHPTSRHSMWIGRPSEDGNWHCTKVSGDIAEEDMISALLDQEGVPE